jgi:hypothetical protein
MTALADLKAVTPTATAKTAFATKGASLSVMLVSIQQDVAELQQKIKQVIADHPNDSVLSATVNAGGSGGTNGNVTITGTTGTGVRFTARGTISGGALTGALTIVNAGSYTTDPTSLTAEPVTGGNLTGASVGLTMSGDTANLTSLSNILAALA